MRPRRGATPTTTRRLLRRPRLRRRREWRRPRWPRCRPSSWARRPRRMPQARAKVRAQMLARRRRRWWRKGGGRPASTSTWLGPWARPRAEDRSCRRRREREREVSDEEREGLSAAWALSELVLVPRPRDSVPLCEITPCEGSNPGGSDPAVLSTVPFLSALVSPPRPLPRPADRPRRAIHPPCPPSLELLTAPHTPPSTRTPREEGRGRTQLRLRGWTAARLRPTCGPGPAQAQAAARLECLVPVLAAEQALAPCWRGARWWEEQEKQP